MAGSMRHALLVAMLAVVLALPADAAEAVKQFDFGRGATPAAEGKPAVPASPVQQGYLGVTPEMSYDRASGYGWGEHGALAGADKVQGDDVQRDFVYGYATTGDQAAHFLVDLPDGAYWAVFYAGDAQYDRMDTPFDILINGQKVVAGWRVAAWAWRVAGFQVQGGQADFVFRNSLDPAQRYSFWLINGLVIHAGTPPADAEAQIAREEDQRREAWIAAHFKEQVPASVARTEQLTKDPMSVVTTEAAAVLPAPITDEDRRRGYVLFARSLTETVYPGTLPTAAERTATLKCAGTPGSYRHVTLGVVPLRDLGSCGVKIGDLTCGRARLAAADSQVYLGRLSRERSGKGLFVWQPKVLDPISEADLSAGKARWWWVTIHVPDKQPPGVYKGQLTFTPRGGSAQTLAVSVEVYPFTVAAPPGDVTGMYWLRSGLYPSVEYMRSEFRDLRAHGCNTITTSAGVRGGFDAEGTLKLDFAALDEIYRVAQEEGLGGPSPWFGAAGLAGLTGVPRTDPAFPDRYRQLVAAIVKHAEEAHWPRLLFYPVDEPSAEEIMAFLPVIKQVPGAYTYCTPNNVDNGLQTVQHMDYACWQHQSANTRTREATLQAGKHFWYYSSNYGESAATARIRSGFLRWRLRATGMFYWHYSHPNGDPYNALDSGATDHCVAYPTPTGPIPSLGWEGEREGIEDYRYAMMLEALIARAKPSSAAAKAARETLDRLAADITDDGKQVLAIPANWTGATFDEYRAKIAAHIIALRREVGEG